MTIKPHFNRFAKAALLFLFFGFIGYSLYACVSDHHAPFADNPPQQRDFSAYAERLRKAVLSSKHLSMEKIGQVEYQGFHAPVWRISFRPDLFIKYRVFINAAIHGNEPAGAECAVRFVEELAKTPQKYSETAFDIIPIVNPWGWVHDIRFNRIGKDINRDFATFKSREARIIQKAVTGTSYHLMLDLHEDLSANGFYLYQYGFTERTVCERIVAAVQQEGYPVEQNVRMVILKTVNGIIEAPMLGVWYMRLTGQLSIANYYRLNNSQSVFTVETPTAMPFKDRLIMQRTAVNMFIDEIGKSIGVFE